MFDIGLNFRATSGYVTDGANEIYVLHTDAYPTTRGGVTFGWSASNPDHRDRSTSVDVRLAGMNFARGTIGMTFRVDLPETGSIDVHAAFGDAGASNTTEWLLKDNTTTFQTISGTPATGYFFDANGGYYSAAAWPGSETALNRIFESTIFILEDNDGSNDAVAHLRFVSADTGEVSITPDDATHSHTAESPTITQVHAISPADALHGHTAESPALTQVHAISPSDATHGHAADSPTLTQVHSLAPADATHGHAAESPSVGEGVAVFPDDALHGHAAESPALTQVHIVSPADALHGHAAESPLITQVHVISPADALHAHYADVAVVSSIDGAFVLPIYFVPLRSDRGYTVPLRSDSGYSVPLRGEPVYGD